MGIDNFKAFNRHILRHALHDKTLVEHRGTHSRALLLGQNHLCASGVQTLNRQFVFESSVA